MLFSLATDHFIPIGNTQNQKCKYLITSSPVNECIFIFKKNRTNATPSTADERTILLCMTRLIKCRTNDDYEYDRTNTHSNDARIYERFGAHIYTRRRHPSLRRRTSRSYVCRPTFVLSTMRNVGMSVFVRCAVYIVRLVDGWLDYGMDLMKFLFLYLSADDAENVEMFLPLNGEEEEKKKRRRRRRRNCE